MTQEEHSAPKEEHDQTEAHVMHAKNDFATEQKMPAKRSKAVQAKAQDQEELPELHADEVMQEEQLAFARRSALQRTPPLTPNQLHLQDESSPDVTVKELPSTLRGAMEQMGACLDALSTLFNGQRHINTLMRVKLSRLTSLHKVASDLCGKGSETANGEAQTSPSLAAGSNLAIALKNASNAAASQSNGNGVTPKRQRESASDQRKTPPKKSKNFLKNPLKRHIVNANSEHDGDPSLRAPPNGWTKVQGRQESQKRVRADAITVTGVGDCSYADMLRMVKTDPSLKHLSGDVQGVRKTAKGDLLLRLSKKPAHSPQELQEAVGKVLGSRAVVKTLSEMSQVEIRDMDELVTKEEVLEAVKGAINDSTTTIDIIKSLRAMKDGSQIATLNMPAIKAKSLVDLGKIRIGWAVCRIKPVLQPKRCFRCQEYGHYAANCTSEEDRKGACFRCGEKGHEARSCSKPPKCQLCIKKGEKSLDHSMGSFRCPAYREALSRIRC
ncbi:hypothetical protein ACLKA6_005682 [Drosophila palustris]